MPAGAPQDRLPAIVSRVAAGEEAALGQLYDVTSPKVFGLAYRILREREGAEEVTLDVYAQVWREAARYDPARGSAMSWLLAIARTRAIDSLRSRRSLRELEQPLESAPEPAVGNGDPEASAAERARAARARRALEQLPAEQRRAIETAFFGGLSHTEAAAVLGIPLGTVKTRIRTGLGTLRRLLQEERGT